MGKYTYPQIYGYPCAHLFFYKERKASLLLLKAYKSMCKLKNSLEFKNSGTSVQSPNRIEQAIGNLYGSKKQAAFLKHFGISWVGTSYVGTMANECYSHHPVAAAAYQTQRSQPNRVNVCARPADPKANQPFSSILVPLVLCKLKTNA